MLRLLVRAHAMGEMEVELEASEFCLEAAIEAAEHAEYEQFPGAAEFTVINLDAVHSGPAIQVQADVREESGFRAAFSKPKSSCWQWPPSSAWGPSLHPTRQYMG